MRTPLNSAPDLCDFVIGGDNKGNNTVGRIEKAYPQIKKSEARFLDPETGKPLSVFEIRSLLTKLNRWILKEKERQKKGHFQEQGSKPDFEALSIFLMCAETHEKIGFSLEGEISCPHFQLDKMCAKTQERCLQTLYTSKDETRMKK